MARRSWWSRTRLPASRSSSVSASGLVRGLLLAVGLLLGLSGLATLALGTALAGTGLWLVVVGGFLIIVAVIERNRYRSEAADRLNDPIGPGGGEVSGPVDVRFRPTSETFVDPTTGTRMRVLLDTRTGERRYVAEAEG
jgi:hypothetical protein